MLTAPHPREEEALASPCFLVMVVVTTGLCVALNLRLTVAMLMLLPAVRSYLCRHEVQLPVRARWCINDNVRSSYHHSCLAIGFRKKRHHGFKASRVPASINRTTNTASGSCNRCTGEYFRNFPLATEAISSPCMDVPYQIGYLPKLGTFLQSLIRYANIVQNKKICTAAQ